MNEGLEKRISGCAKYLRASAGVIALFAFTEAYAQPAVIPPEYLQRQAAAVQVEVEKKEPEHFQFYRSLEIPATPEEINVIHNSVSEFVRQRGWTSMKEFQAMMQESVRICGKGYTLTEHAKVYRFVVKAMEENKYNDRLDEQTDRVELLKIVFGFMGEDRSPAALGKEIFDLMMSDSYATLPIDQYRKILQQISGKNTAERISTLVKIHKHILPFSRENADFYLTFTSMLGDKSYDELSGILSTFKGSKMGVSDWNGYLKDANFAYEGLKSLGASGEDIRTLGSFIQKTTRTGIEQIQEMKDLIGTLYEGCRKMGLPSKEITEFASAMHNRCTSWYPPPAYVNAMLRMKGYMDSHEIKGLGAFMNILNNYTPSTPVTPDSLAEFMVSIHQRSYLLQERSIQYASDRKTVLNTYLSDTRFQTIDGIIENAKEYAGKGVQTKGRMSDAYITKITQNSEAMVFTLVSGMTKLNCIIKDIKDADSRKKLLEDIALENKRHMPEVSIVGNFSNELGPSLDVYRIEVNGRSYDF